MFINVSNHPSAKWSEDQKSSALEMAKMIGSQQKIVDIPFPAVDPNATIRDIDMLAEKVLTTIDSLHVSEDDKVVVMLQGEMTLVYQIAKNLEKWGVLTVAATTERISVDNPDGTITKTFRFVGFRPYF